MKSKKERIQFEDGEKIEFPTVEEKPVVEGIILPKNLFSSNNELIHPLKLREAKLAKKKEKELAKKKEKVVKKKELKKVKKTVAKKSTKPAKKTSVKSVVKKSSVKKTVAKAKSKPAAKSSKQKVSAGKKKSIFSMFGKKNK